MRLASLERLIEAVAPVPGTFTVAPEFLAQLDDLLSSALCRPASLRAIPQ